MGDSKVTVQRQSDGRPHPKDLPERHCVVCIAPFQPVRIDQFIGRASHPTGRICQQLLTGAEMYNLRNGDYTRVVNLEGGRCFSCGKPGEGVALPENVVNLLRATAGVAPLPTVTPLAEGEEPVKLYATITDPYTLVEGYLNGHGTVRGVCRPCRSAYYTTLATLPMGANLPDA